MRVLVACEFSGVVRDAFARAGHYAVSCDLLPSETPGLHIEADVLSVLGDGWDLMIAHPPCTHLAVSGARYFAEKKADGRQDAALDFVRALLAAPIPRICLENPVSIISSRIRKPDQIIQPHFFGHAETKATCLWLKNLPALLPTNMVEPDFMRRPDGSYYTDKKGKRYSRIHYMTRRVNGEDRWKARSRTYSGIAEAMADQWGNLASQEAA